MTVVAFYGAGHQMTCCLDPLCHLFLQSDKQRRQNASNVTQMSNNVAILEPSREKLLAGIVARNALQRKKKFNSIFMHFLAFIEAFSQRLVVLNANHSIKILFLL